VHGLLEASREMLGPLLVIATILLRDWTDCAVQLNTHIVYVSPSSATVVFDLQTAAWPDSSQLPLRGWTPLVLGRCAHTAIEAGA
jgi:hypothetical protein